MTLEKCIAQLKGLRQNREDFLDGEFMDDPYAADIEAIDTALAAIDDLLKAHKLLKAAMDDMNTLYETGKDEGCIGIKFKWRFADEALKLIEGSVND